MKLKAWGFTLVELLVAIAIFAGLSALGWKAFDYIAKSKLEMQCMKANWDNYKKVTNKY